MSNFDADRRGSRSSKTDTHYWLALLRCPDIGSARIRQLLNHFGSVEQIFNSPNDLNQCTYLSSAAKRYIKSPAWEDVEQDFIWLDKPQNTLINLSDTEYPQRLREIPNPPTALFVAGNTNCLQLPQLAVVGSRNPSRHGYEQAFAFSQDLSRSGLVITSGLAIGIDGASHKGALAGNGATIAVFGSGLDHIYPKKHIQLAERILENGALVSEYSPNSRPLAHQFPQRNRIISGLTLGTLVVEAALKSGSLITAKFALEQNREVFAIPGSIHNPLIKGCHFLIKQGAKLVEGSADIWEEIGPSIISMTKFHAADLSTSVDRDKHRFGKDKQQKNELLTELEQDPNEAMIMAQMGYEPTSIDTLMTRCNLTVEEISSILVQLEIKGRIASTGGLYSRVHN